MRIMHISRATLMVYQFLVPVIKGQKQKGHYVCVCASDDSYAQKLRDIGIDVFPHRLKRNLSPLSIIRGIFRIKRILIEQNIDVVICHSPIGGGVGRIAARLARVPTIVYFVHGYTCAPAQSIFKWLIWFCIEKQLGKFTDAALVMNSYDEKLCEKHYLVKDTHKIFRIPGMGVDLGKFKEGTVEDVRRQIEKEFAIPTNQKFVLCTAFLVREKGIFILLEAARQICARRNDVCFLLAGTGACMDRLTYMRNSYKLQKYFKILGWRNDISLLMRAADIFVLPSYYWEGVPVSILEAMACAKPVVATKNRGCVDAVVDKETGFLVPFRKINPLVKKISILLDNEQLRTQMGRAGRKRVEKHFELNDCTQSILEALEKCASI